VTFSGNGHPETLETPISRTAVIDPPKGSDGIRGEASIPEEFLLSGDFARSGSDLLVTAPSGDSLVVPRFFSQEQLPDLVSPGGARMDGEWVSRLAGPQAPAQYAQAELAQADAPIGTVESLSGSVTVTHVDGSQAVIGKGDAIFQGDVLETGTDGAVGVLLADDTTFSLGENGSIVMDELIYNPALETGEATLNLVKGVFTFVSGQISKTGTEAMVVKTPVATIGIRGTSGGIEVEPPAPGDNGPGPEGGGPEAKMTVVLTPDPDGSIGEMAISNGGGTQVLNKAFQGTSVASFNAAPQAPFTVNPAQYQANFQSALNSLPPSPSNRGPQQQDDQPQEGEPQEGEGEGEPQEGEGEGEGDPEQQAEGEGEPEELAEGEGEPGEGEPGEGGPEQVAEGEGDPEQQAEGEAPVEGEQGAEGGEPGAEGPQGGPGDGPQNTEQNAQGDAPVGNPNNPGGLPGNTGDSGIITGGGGDGAISGGEGDTGPLGGGNNNPFGGPQGNAFGNQNPIGPIQQIQPPQTDPVDQPPPIKYEDVNKPKVLNGTASGEVLTGADDTSVQEVTVSSTLVQRVHYNAADLIYGYGGDDTINGGAGDDTLYGGAGADSITGGTGNNTAYGGLGADTFIGSAGTDTIADGDGSDFAYLSDGWMPVSVERDGNDLIAAYQTDDGSQAGSVRVANQYASTFGSSGVKAIKIQDLHDATTISTTYIINDSTAYAASGVIDGSTTAITTVGANDTEYLFAGTSGADVVSAAGQSNSTIDVIFVGNGGDDTFTGGAGDDVFVGGAGNDTYTGGSGYDEVYYGAATTGMTVSLASSTASGLGTDKLSGIENVTGSRYADTITGDANANWIDGGLGNDAIDGGGGVDTVDYRDSDSLVTVNLDTGSVTGGMGDDTLSNIENVYGSDYADTITGNVDANSLYGYKGNDSFIGSAGGDTIDGGDGTDTVDYSGVTGSHNIDLAGGMASLNGGVSVDTLYYIEAVISGDGADTIFGNSDTVSIIAGGGDDYVKVRSGNQTLDGGSTGETNGDRLDYGFIAGDSVNANLNTGTVSFGTSTHTISNFEHLTGSNQNDILTGCSGANSINGGTGDDSINGGQGDDVLTGGSGNDIFSFSGGTGAVGTVARITTLGTDTITDFISGTDIFKLSDADFGFGTSGDLTAGTNYFETTTAPTGSAVSLGASNAGFVVVGAATGTAGVDVYFTEDVNAFSTSNSYQIATIDGTNTGDVANTDFGLSS